MKIKHIISPLIICMILYSCKPSFDLMDVDLNTTNVNDVIQGVKYKSYTMGGEVI